MAAEQLNQLRKEKAINRRGFGGFPRQLTQTPGEKKRLPQGVVLKTIMVDGKPVEVKRFQKTRVYH
jgi:hypothetical protein